MELRGQLRVELWSCEVGELGVGSGGGHELVAECSCLELLLHAGEATEKELRACLDAAAAALVRHVIHERAQERLVLVSSHDPVLLAQADQVITLPARDREARARQLP